MANMFSGFLARPQALGDSISQGLGALASNRQAQQQAQAVRNSEVEAAELLDQSLRTAKSDPAQSEQLFIQAMQKAPDFVQKVTTGLGARREALGAGQPKPMTDYQRESLRLREMEAALKREDNDLRREKLQQDIQLQKAKVQKTEQETQLEAEAAETSEARAISMAEEARDLAREIAGDKGLSSATGSKAYVEYLPTTTGTSDLVNKAFRLQSMLTVDNLSMMTGVLTDKDIQFLTAVSSGLDIDPEKRGIIGSEEVVRDRLNEIADKIDEKLSGMGKTKAPAKASGNAPASAIDYLRSNPELIGQFEAKYGYRPEGF